MHGFTEDQRLLHRPATVIASCSSQTSQSMSLGDRVKSQDPSEQKCSMEVSIGSIIIIILTDRCADRCAPSGTLPCMCKPEPMNYKGVSWPQFESDDGSSFGGKNPCPLFPPALDRYLLFHQQDPWWPAHIPNTALTLGQVSNPAKVIGRDVPEHCPGSRCLRAFVVL
jgi:hypothetical protein